MKKNIELKSNLLTWAAIYLGMIIINSTELLRDSFNNNVEPGLNAFRYIFFIPGILGSVAPIINYYLFSLVSTKK